MKVKRKFPISPFSNRRRGKQGDEVKCRENDLAPAFPFDFAQGPGHPSPSGEGK
jgi:hypothetical protein